MPDVSITDLIAEARKAARRSAARNHDYFGVLHDLADALIFSEARAAEFEAIIVEARHYITTERWDSPGFDPLAMLNLYKLSTPEGAL